MCEPSEGEGEGGAESPDHIKHNEIATILSRRWHKGRDPGNAVTVSIARDLLMIP